MNLRVKFLFVAMLMILAIGISSCKKNNDKVDAGSLPRLKSMTSTDNFHYQETLEFTYQDDGNVSQVKQYLSGQLANVMEYVYEKGALTKALNKIPDASGQSELVAEATFSYTQQRLTGIYIGQKGSRTNGPATRYSFSYGNSEIPIKVTSSLEGGGFGANQGMPHMDPGTGTFIYEDADPDGDSPVIPDPDFKYEYDDQHNPLYHLPWITSGKLQALPFPGVVASPTYLYLFDAEAFFNPHNKVKQYTEGGSFGYMSINTYTYNSQGEPVTRRQTTGIRPGVLATVETVYAYE